MSSSNLRREIATVFEEELEPSPQIASWVFLEDRPPRRSAGPWARLAAAAAALLVAASAGYYAYRYGIPGVTPAAPVPAAVFDGDYLSVGAFPSGQAGWIVRRGSEAVNTPDGVTSDALFQTTDGGRSWHERLRFKGEYDSMVFSADGSHGVAWGMDTGAPQCQGAPPGCTPAARPALVFSTIDGGVTWKPAPAPPGSFYTGAFMTPDQGWMLTEPAVGPGALDVYATTDGGSGWALVGHVTLSGYNSFGLTLGTYSRAFSFTDASHGWLVPNSYSPASTPALLATADGGRTWRGVNLALPEGVGGELSAGAPRIFAGGSGILPVTVRAQALSPNGPEPPSQVLIYSTNDGGATWGSPRPLFPAGSAQAGELLVGTMGIWDFSDSRHWYVMNQTGTGGGPWAPRPHLLVTADGGTTWTTYGNSPDISDLHFTSATEGWAEDQTYVEGVGNVNGLLRTTDGGAHWTRIALPRTR